MAKTKLAARVRVQTAILHMRVAPMFLRLIDDWRRGQTDMPSRTEAVRRLVARGLTR